MSELRPLAIFYPDKVIECGFEDDEEVELTFKFKVWKKWLDAPHDGVQAVVVQDPRRSRVVLRGNSYFYTLADGLCQQGQTVEPYLNQHLNGLVKFGVCLSDADYKKVMQQVSDYQKIPRNSPRTEPEQDADVD